jgi:hypothetical protein
MVVPVTLKQTVDPSASIFEKNAVPPKVLKLPSTIALEMVRLQSLLEMVFGVSEDFKLFRVKLQLVAENPVEQLENSMFSNCTFDVFEEDIAVTPFENEMLDTPVFEERISDAPVNTTPEE